MGGDEWYRGYLLVAPIHTPPLWQVRIMETPQSIAPVPQFPSLSFGIGATAEEAIAEAKRIVDEVILAR